MVQKKIRDINAIKEQGLSEEIWNKIIERCICLFNMDEDYADKVRNNRVMKLVAALPFIAGCINPERTAVSHMTIYLLACQPAGKDLFMHSFADNDDLFTRLERISHFDGGDQQIIDRGMQMLAFAMLEDHLHDKKEDHLNDKYNPLNSGVWNYDKISKKLLTDIKSVECRQLDEILNVDAGTRGYWSPD